MAVTCIVSPKVRRFEDHFPPPFSHQTRSGSVKIQKARENMRRPAREGSHGVPASQANATPAAQKNNNQRTPRMAFANTDKRHRGARIEAAACGSPGSAFGDPLLAQGGTAVRRSPRLDRSVPSTSSTPRHSDRGDAQAGGASGDAKSGGDLSAPGKYIKPHSRCMQRRQQPPPQPPPPQQPPRQHPLQQQPSWQQRSSARPVLGRRINQSARTAGPPR